MIDFDLSHRPGRPSEWANLAAAVWASKEPEESYWLELKSELAWGSSHGVGTLARAILGMANRDPVRASSVLEGRGIVIVGLSPGKVHPVEVLDAADLDNKLTAYLGADGPRWEPHWVKVDGESVLVIEVDAPRNGDPGYILRKAFSDYRASQMFVRDSAKTNPASQADIVRLSRRLVATDAPETLAVEVGFSLPLPLSKMRKNETAIDTFLKQEERELLESLDAFQASQGPFTFPLSGAGAVLSARNSAGRSFSFGVEQHEEDRTPEEFRAEVSSYLEEARKSMIIALWRIAKILLPRPTFWVSNLSEKNFKEVQITINVAGKASAEDADDDRTPSVRESLPARPRPFGPYSKANEGLAALMRSNYNFSYAAPHVASTWVPTRRDIRNGGSFEVDLDGIDLRPGDREVEVESDLVVMIPDGRDEPVIVHWRATASNVDAIAEGEFELPFDGGSFDLLSAGLAADRDSAVDKP